MVNAGTHTRKKYYGNMIEQKNSKVKSLKALVYCSNQVWMMSIFRYYHAAENILQMAVLQQKRRQKTHRCHFQSAGTVLAQCSVLTHLDLGLNRMGPCGAESLAPVLGQCATLTHLNLSGNLIGPKGARSLGRVLGNFTALVHLDLSGNVFGAEGAQSLVGVLVHSTTLTHLDLGFNEIGPEGGESLMMLVQCTALTHIILDHNFIDAWVLRALGTDRRGRDRRRHSAQKN